MFHTNVTGKVKKFTNGIKTCQSCIFMNQTFSFSLQSAKRGTITHFQCDLILTPCFVERKKDSHRPETTGVSSQHRLPRTRPSPHYKPYCQKSSRKYVTIKKKACRELSQSRDIVPPAPQRQQRRTSLTCPLSCCFKPPSFIQLLL